ncbi:MAG: hypothetical protein INQ03_14315 [Candidatus Heimdallarchaeota archaeon]|nr:hypothetical protein [Candidatus Heimdallarchaeota archaeon]
MAHSTTSPKTNSISFSTISIKEFIKIIKSIKTKFSKVEEVKVQTIEEIIASAFQYSEEIEKARIRQTMKKPEVKPFYIFN